MAVGRFLSIIVCAKNCSFRVYRRGSSRNARKMGSSSSETHFTISWCRPDSRSEIVSGRARILLVLVNLCCAPYSVKPSTSFNLYVNSLARRATNGCSGISFQFYENGLIRSRAWLVYPLARSLLLLLFSECTPRKDFLIGSERSLFSIYRIMAAASSP